MENKQQHPIEINKEKKEFIADNKTFTSWAEAMTYLKNASKSVY